MKEITILNIKNMVLEQKNGPKELDMKENFQMDKNMAKVFLTGQMAANMLENFRII